MSATRIVVNGRKYERVEDMPPEVRGIYEQAIASLAGDSETARAAAAGSQRVRIQTKTRFVVNGNEYSSVDEMPPAIRQAYDKAAQRPSQVTAGTITPALLERVAVQTRLDTKAFLTRAVGAAVSLIALWALMRFLGAIAAR